MNSSTAAIAGRMDAAESAAAFWSGQLELVSVLRDYAVMYFNAVRRMEQLDRSKIPLLKTFDFRIATYRELGQVYDEAVRLLDAGDVGGLLLLDTRVPSILRSATEQELAIRCEEMLAAGFARSEIDSCS